MDVDLILKNVGKHISLTKKEKEFFTSLLKEKQVNKKSFVLSEGQGCTKFNFVDSGILRAYYALIALLIVALNV